MTPQYFDKKSRFVNQRDGFFSKNTEGVLFCLSLPNNQAFLSKSQDILLEFLFLSS
jgi:hypothetical protein